MQALVRVQAHMLARIVVEIRAADIAVELEPQRRAPPKTLEKHRLSCWPYLFFI
jgi:hypothetical protein